ncbi:unnamed protein product, partial [Mesorhabditis spiculigera]
MLQYAIIGFLTYEICRLWQLPDAGKIKYTGINA